MPSTPSSDGSGSSLQCANVRARLVRQETTSKHLSKLKPDVQIVWNTTAECQLQVDVKASNTSRKATCHRTPVGVKVGLNRVDKTIWADLPLLVHQPRAQHVCHSITIAVENLLERWVAAVLSTRDL